MKQSHYPSLELCKKLTEIGFPEATSCHFRKNNSDTYEHTFGPWNDESYVCPSVMEMLDVMPKTIDFLGEKCLRIMYIEEEKTWEVMYQCDSTGKYEYGELPDALAEMILWLHEEKYISF